MGFPRISERGVAAPGSSRTPSRVTANTESTTSAMAAGATWNKVRPRLDGFSDTRLGRKTTTTCTTDL
jgi:hypothetical protein